MSNIRQTIVWAIFIVSIFMIWNQWQVHNGNPPLFGANPNAKDPQVQTTPEGTQTQPDVPTLSEIGNGSGGAALAIPNEVVETTTKSAGENILITTDEYQVTFNTAGGRIVGLSLLNHFDQNDEEKSIELISPNYDYEIRTGLINTQSNGVALPTHNTIMHMTSTQKNMVDGQDSLQVTFASDEVNGIQMVKTYEFKRGQYVIDVQTKIINNSADAIAPRIYYQIARNGTVLPGGNRWFGGNTFTGPAYYNSDTKYKKLSFADLEKGKAAVNEFESDGWIAMVQHYFMSAWLLDDGIERNFFTKNLPNNIYSIGLSTLGGTIKPGETFSQKAQLYSGPQNEKVLQNLAPGLELVKDYGMFRILSKPLFWLLHFLNEFLHNWGWSIVALVVLLKAAFFWLNARAYQSMAKMRALSPRLQEINERFKDEPQQKQQATMQLYREEKINPLGGCLPILVQIPVFIALYWVLLSSVEMRHAPWIGWITDLSAKDPYYILPAVMAASTVFQTWLNPKPADPMQAKMMWMMPIMFSVLFFMFPAGLVLYWVTNNLLSIAQQWFINNKIIGKKTTT